MQDLYLSFPDEAAAKGVLYEEFPEKLDENLNVISTYLVPNFRNIDTIGVIYKRTGGTDEEPTMTAVPGWHVNVRLADGEDADVLADYVVQPQTPLRVWF